MTDTDNFGTTSSPFTYLPEPDQCLGHAIVLTREYIGHGPILSFTPAAIVTAFQTIYAGIRAAVAGEGSWDTASAGEPAVPIEESVTDDYIVCLDDGKQFQSLKRHLKQLGMTPAEYRTKWHLDADYSMVAKNYSEKRSTLAKAAGLGRK